jgi:hypothetical protein
MEIEGFGVYDRNKELIEFWIIFQILHNQTLYMKIGVKIMNLTVLVLDTFLPLS